MLYQKRINKIIGDIDKFFDTIDQALLIFGEGVKNYLYTNVEAFKGNLQTMTRLVGIGLSVLCAVLLVAGERGGTPSQGDRGRTLQAVKSCEA